MSHLIRLAPNLKVMIYQPRNSSLYFDGYSSNSDNLSNRQLASMGVSRTKNLVTFHTTNCTSTTFNFLISCNVFPFLRHLAIDITREHNYLKQEAVHSFLQHIGAQLHTFHFRHRMYPSTLDPSLWSILPNIESIQFPFQWDLSDVPKDHPLKRVQVAAWEIPYWFDKEAMWKVACSVHWRLSFHRKLSCPMQWIGHGDTSYLRTLLSLFTYGAISKKRAHS